MLSLFALRGTFKPSPLRQIGGYGNKMCESSWAIVVLA